MPTDEERAEFKRGEYEAMRGIVAGDLLCPDPSAHAAASPSTVGGEAALRLLTVEQVERVLFEELPNSDEWNDRIFGILARLSRDAALLQEFAATASQEQAGPDPARSFARWFMGQPLQIQGDFIREWHRQHPKVSAEQAAEPGLDVPTLAEAMQRWESEGWKDYEDSEITYERQAAWVRAEYARLRSQQPASDR